MRMTTEGFATLCLGAFVWALTANAGTTPDARWTLDDGSGTVAADSSGNNYHGDLKNGPVWTTGTLGGALSFDGTDDYVAIRDLNYAQAGTVSAVSVAFWMKTSSPGRNAIVDFDRSEYWSVGVNFPNVSGEEGRISWGTTDSAATIHDLASTARVDDGVWHHICVVFDSSAVNDKKIYIDGTLNVQQDAYATGAALGSGEPRFGFLGDGSEATAFDGSRNSYFYNGALDDVRIYHSVLTLAEIEALAGILNEDPVIDSGPTATPNPATVAQTVTFHAGASDPDGDTPIYDWDFGDATAASGSDVTHVYAAAGSYQATVTVTDGRGGSASASVQVVVNPAQTAAVGESGQVTVAQADSTEWHTVNLVNNYIDPVVVMGALSYNGGDPSTLRVRNVTGNSFEFQIDEWDYKDGAHTTESFGYVVVEAGEHALADGSLLKAGTAAVNNEWSSISFPSVFPTTPVVLSQCMSTNESSAVSTRQRSVAATGFSVTVQEEEANGTVDVANGPHATETVGWVAMEIGTGDGGPRFEVQKTPDVVDHNWYALAFQQSFATAPILLAGMQTFDGWNSGTVRYQNLGAAGAEVFMEEEASFDEEIAHTQEVVGYLVLEEGLLMAQGGTLNEDPVIDPGPTATPNPATVGQTVSFHASASDPDGDTPIYDWDFGDATAASGSDVTHVYAATGSYQATVTVTDGQGGSASASVQVVVNPAQTAAVGESGRVTVAQADSTEWHTVNLVNNYINPVVVMGALSYNGADPSNLRVQNVTGNSFEFQIDEWDYKDGAHTTESFGYMVVEAGEHALADGSLLKAGTATVNNEWSSISFPSAFPTTPVVLSQCMSTNESSAVTTRQRSVAATGFSVTVQEEEANGTVDGANGPHATETVGWVAMEIGTGDGGPRFEVQKTPDAVDHNWYALGFQQSFATAPILLAGMQTFDGWNSGTVRYQNLGAAGAEVFMEEEASFDEEIAHTQEVVGYLVLEEGLLMAQGGPAPDPTLSLVASTTTPGVGDTFTVTVQLADAPPFANWGQFLQFDGSRLNLVSQSVGSFTAFVPDSRSTADINASGEVRAGGTAFADNAGGSGALGVFTLQVVAAGTTQISTANKAPAIPFGNSLKQIDETEILPEIVGGTLTITIQP